MQSGQDSKGKAVSAPCVSVGGYNFGLGDPYPRCLIAVAGKLVLLLCNDKSAVSEGLWASDSFHADWASSHCGVWVSRPSLPRESMRQKTRTL